MSGGSVSQCQSSCSVLVLIWELRKWKNLQNVDTLDLLAGQSKVGSKLAIKSGKEEAGSDIREEADGGLGHGKHGPLGGDTERRMDAEADAAATEAETAESTEA